MEELVNSNKSIPGSWRLALQHLGVRAVIVLLVVFLTWGNTKPGGDSEELYGAILAWVFFVIVVIPYLAMPLAIANSIPGSWRLALQHLGVRAVIVLLVVFLTWGNTKPGGDSEELYGAILAWVFFVIVVIPYLAMPLAIANCLGLALFNPMDRPRDTKSLYTAPYISFRMVTKGECPNFILNNAVSNKEMCLASGLRNFIVEIVTDKSINAPHDNYIKETVVPESYTTKRGTLFKARALNYCLEKEVNILAGNEWIVHLDEESLLTEEAILGILEFIHENRADIGQGPINYASSHVIPNWLVTLADCVRVGLDYAFFRFQFTCLKAPVFGFKGSYIIVRNRVEMDVGFDFGPKGSIAEDCYFALKAWTKGYTFGFVKGQIREKSPFTIMDFIRQRRRWFVGLFFIACSGELPLLKRAGVILNVVCCVLMPLSITNVFLSVFVPFKKPFYQCVLTGFIGGTFSSVCFVGTFLSLYKRRWTYRRLIFVCLLNSCVMFPVSAIFECVATIWGLFTLNTKQFFVIRKTIDVDVV